MSDSDTIRVLLAGRAAVYRLLQNILGNEPSAEMLEQLSGQATHQVFRLFDDEQTKFGQAAEALIAVSNECKSGGEETLDKLSSGFTRLFVGPGKLEANPWESYYLSTTGILFQKTTLEVRRDYVAQGILPAQYPSVADDHVAIELDFLASLAQRAEESWTAGDTAAVLSAVTASDDFLRKHLVKWADVFAAAVANSKYGYFYKEAAAVLTAFLPVDLDALDELRDALNK